MTRPTHLIGTLASVAVLGLAAGCGGSGYSSSSSSSQSKPTAPSSAVVSTGSATGVGSVLVDSSGKTLYTPAQEAGGKILCTSGCAAVWPPLTVASADALAGHDMGGKLTTVKRADGKLQVAYNGAPLYRFKLDRAAGAASGNGAHDKFGSNSFDWRALKVGAAKKSGAQPKPSSSSSGGSYGSGY